MSNTKWIDDLTQDLDAQASLASQGLEARPEVYSISKFAHNTNIGALEELIWSPGGVFAGFLATAEAIRIRAGGNVADDAAGVGAQSVVLQFVNDNWDMETAVLTTAGVAASAPTASTGFRLWRAAVLDAGAYDPGPLGASQANVADIILEGASSGTHLASIPAAKGSTFLALFSVPRGYTALLRRIRFDIEGQGAHSANTFIWTRPRANITTPPVASKKLLREFIDVQGNVPVEFKSYPVLPEYTDIWATAASASGPTPLSVEFYMDLLLVENG